ncbi:5-formyltetrahydrofolate cyclo-ligase [Tenacibaculum sp. MAR_2009_124]|uniref:5-formyltetrahydrofolate cyclo-ligase n=1 Tax=Tenacibaculum sp. MAR_2009_124 TaxID=1250059 RepID=UPI000898C460|nr:5-formyltetrahydrofolate cyclo-ligase [Tenacibaculum sp. MAR_2009_124]SEB71874.1 5-formyltetrahydrofolate cyclo-ligase [Tenacibaculum sp. MAR_2009_124]
MNKKDARKLYKQKRTELSKTEIDLFQKSIYDQIYDLDFSKIQNIHIFLSITRHKEINTYPIVDFLHKHNKTVIVSKSNFENNTLQHYILTENTKLIENNYGIPEPINAQQVEVKNIDLVFVPLLVADKKNYRVGYGKGFYDRFLASCRKDITTIGLNFYPPIESITDINKLDVPLNKIIYPA